MSAIVTNECIKTLLKSVVDYAGLFPPAQLPLEPAFQNYANYRQGPHSWMLGRFVCPAGKLEELASFSDDLLALDPPIVFSILMAPSDDSDDFVKKVEQGLELMADFGRQFPGQVDCDSIELRWPKAFVDHPEDQRWGECVTWATEQTQAAGFGTASLFFELPLPPDAITPAVINSALAGLAEGEGSAGFKIRTGGLEPGAFPSSLLLAQVIDACRQANIYWKATAGLHHPFRHQATLPDGQLAQAHGFLNVLTANVLAYVHELSVDELVRVLDDTLAEHFQFDAQGLAWCEHRVKMTKVRQSRKAGMVSYGSCSFDEPVHDLQQLALLD